MQALSSRRLQSQLVVMVGAVVFIAGVVVLQHSAFAGSGRASPVDPAFALMWIIGAACAIGAASQAKFHRLAALIMVGGAGLDHLPDVRVVLGA